MVILARYFFQNSLTIHLCKDLRYHLTLPIERIDNTAQKIYKRRALGISPSAGNNSPIGGQIMKLKMIAMVFLLVSCGNLVKRESSDQGSNTAAYAYGNCGQNRIFAKYYTNGMACVYTRAAEDCRGEAVELVSLNTYLVSTDALERALNQSVGPNAFIDLENEDVMATVGVETIRGIKSAVKRVEQEQVSKHDELAKKEAWKICTDNGRTPYSENVQGCINYRVSESRGRIPYCR